MVLFIVSSLLHGIFTWLGRSFSEVDSTSEKMSASLFGFHTRTSVEKYVQGRYLKPALLSLQARNWSFVFLVILSLIEYVTR